ncbi:hypothetical protein HYN48_14075 [Flavobacterium magnum]|uniref:DUF6933 domain-containing protein n=1 Tax=Flavobacterium magnum TaxID=2162713 RepID=A0A2S0RGQ6_9FLAO|nr:MULTISPECIES: hypothetical protein [Flavobacterium]AWA31127.1 hypothetical protein HYN48_14075 [Flavobacterium magnum]OYU80205.1 MAG: hypothetical protein CFE23_10840 [Flavobacterium sp. BFFFF1]
MINVFCSLKLAKLLDIQKTVNVNVNFESDWNAHLFSVAGKKWIIFVNKKTLFSFIIMDVLKKDLNNLSILFTEMLIKQLEREFILTSKYENYLREYDQIANICTTDNDRKIMGSLNDFVYHTKACYEDDKNVEKARNYALRYINEMPSKVLKFKTPREAMKEHIKNYG